MADFKASLEEMDPEKFLRNMYLGGIFFDENKIVDRWGYIRQMYMENIADIMNMADSDKTRWANFIDFNWEKHFSPIEKSAWSSIQTYGRTPLYPQFPLFNFFIDFANPYLKIGLELDGKGYHDSNKDSEKDNFLAKYGWVIFRSTGREANNYSCLDGILDSGQNLNYKKTSIQNWLLNSTDGLIYSIRYWYFLDDNDKTAVRNIDLNEYSEDEIEVFDIHPIIEQTLYNHTSADFKNQPFKKI